MNWFKRRRAPDPVTVQLRDGEYHPFGILGSCVPLSSAETRLYRAVREAVPVVDAAIYKLIRMTGGVDAVCTDRQAQKALSEFLRPEFLNRVDEIICFNRLSEENFRGIAAIMLGELKTALEEHGVALRWNESVIDYLVQKSYTLTYGARNLRRTIQKDIEDVVAEKLIDSYENPITAIGLQAQDGKLELSCL